MPRKNTILAFALIGGAVLSGSLAYHLSNSAASPAPKTLKAKAGRTPVIVELFTSEGCSSCPSADTLLAKLNREQSVDGAEIIALSEHVDYWNSRSWSDPYSSAAFSGRQEIYHKSLRLDSVYTPQMVVDGHEEFVGSDADRAASAIAKAAKIAKTEVDLTGDVRDNSLHLKIKVAPVTGLPSGEKAEVLLAITEDNLHSQVVGGENSGRRLNHSAVVRELKNIGTAAKGSGFETTLTLPINARWKRGDLQAVIFVQGRNSRRVFGAARIGVKG